MARTRQLKPDFFLNEDLAKKDPLTRLLFAGLWVLADREGRLEDRPGKIKAQIFPYHEADVDGMLTSLCGGFVSRYEVKGERFLEVVNFKKHQHVHPDEKQSVFPKNPGIPGDFKRRSEIMPCTTSTSSSPSTSTSPKQPEQAPIDLKKLGEIAKDPKDVAGDYSGYRLPVNFGGRYGAAYVVNLTPDDCSYIIKTLKPGPKVRAALEWRIKTKAAESIR